MEESQLAKRSKGLAVDLATGMEEQIRGAARVSEELWEERKGKETGFVEGIILAADADTKSQAQVPRENFQTPLIQMKVPVAPDGRADTAFLAHDGRYDTSSVVRDGRPDSTPALQTGSADTAPVLEHDRADTNSGSENRKADASSAPQGKQADNSPVVQNGRTGMGHLTETPPSQQGGTGGAIPLVVKDGKNQWGVCMIREPRELASPSWLPAGWKVVEKTRLTGKSAGSKDKYYHELSTGRQFRSKNEVVAYVDSGGKTTKTPKSHMGTKPPGQTPSPIPTALQILAEVSQLGPTDPSQAPSKLPILDQEATAQVDLSQVAPVARAQSTREGDVTGASHVEVSRMGASQNGATHARLGTLDWDEKGHPKTAGEKPRVNQHPRVWGSSSPWGGDQALAKALAEEENGSAETLSRLRAGVQGEQAAGAQPAASVAGPERQAREAIPGGGLLAGRKREAEAVESQGAEKRARPEAPVGRGNGKTGTGMGGSIVPAVGHPAHAARAPGTAQTVPGPSTGRETEPPTKSSSQPRHVPAGSLDQGGTTDGRASAGWRAAGLREGFRDAGAQATPHAWQPQNVNPTSESARLAAQVVMNGVERQLANLNTALHAVQSGKGVPLGGSSQPQGVANGPSATSYGVNGVQGPGGSGTSGTFEWVAHVLSDIGKSRVEGFAGGKPGQGGNAYEAAGFQASRGGLGDAVRAGSGETEGPLPGGGQPLVDTRAGVQWQQLKAPGMPPAGTTTQSGSLSAGATQPGIPPAGTRQPGLWPAGSSQPGMPPAGTVPAGTRPAGTSQPRPLPAGNPPGASTFPPHPKLAPPRPEPPVPRALSPAVRPGLAECHGRPMAHPAVQGGPGSGGGSASAFGGEGYELLNRLRAYYGLGNQEEATGGKLQEPAVHTKAFPPGQSQGQFAPMGMQPGSAGKPQANGWAPPGGPIHPRAVLSKGMQAAPSSLVQGFPVALRNRGSSEGTAGLQQAHQVAVLTRPEVARSDPTQHQARTATFPRPTSTLPTNFPVPNKLDPTQLNHVGGSHSRLDIRKPESRKPDLTQDMPLGSQARMPSASLHPHRSPALGALHHFPPASTVSNGNVHYIQTSAPVAMAMPAGAPFAPLAGLHPHQVAVSSSKSKRGPLQKCTSTPEDFGQVQKSMSVDHLGDQQLQQAQAKKTKIPPARDQEVTQADLRKGLEGLGKQLCQQAVFSLVAEILERHAETQLPISKMVSKLPPSLGGFPGLGKSEQARGADAVAGTVETQQL